MKQTLSRELFTLFNYGESALLPFLNLGGNHFLCTVPVVACK